MSGRRRDQEVAADAAAQFVHTVQELREEGEKRIRLRFGVQKLMEEKEITVTPEEVKEMTTQTLASVPEEQRQSAEGFYAQGNEGYDQLVWQKKVEKMVKLMLA